MRYYEYKELREHGSIDFPIELYHITSQHPRYTMSFHWHIEYEIVRVLEGVFKIFINGREYSASKGDILFINSGLLHGGSPYDCVYECLVFDSNMLLKHQSPHLKDLIKKFMDYGEIKEFYPESDSPVNTTINNIFRAMYLKHPGYELVVYGALYEMLGLMVESDSFCLKPAPNSISNKNVIKLKKVLELIEENYQTQLSLETMSKACSMTPQYFSRFFKHYTHRSPIDYLNYYRIECACEQLKNTGRSITETALDCGFNDLSYFIKTFKHYKGVTPRQYSEGEVLK